MLTLIFVATLHGAPVWARTIGHFHTNADCEVARKNAPAMERRLLNLPNKQSGIFFCG